ncbi:MAG: TatD family hydrolase, partial [Actinomycetota bacterium]|nr:TatD family hydrolase [Actinomycetota bacterium]
THCHLDSCRGPVAGLVERARAAGITRLGTVGTDPASARSALTLADEHPEVSAIVGVHPNHATGFSARSVEEHDESLFGYAHSEHVVAIGETGLDYYRDHAPREDQRRAFEAHIDLARQLDLPVVIHTRAAEEATFAMLGERAEGLTVVLHCFSAPDRLDEAVERGYVCSFAGNVTYPSAADLQDAAERVPDELLLVETDSPYLSPQPVRKEANEPANVALTARFVAERRGVPYEELEATVERNAARVFGW